MYPDDCDDDDCNAPEAADQPCDECDEPEAADYGHAILCAECAEGAGDPGPSDFECRQAERRQMGICDR